jgi:hypothetical protein
MAKIEPINIGMFNVTGISNIREIIDDVNQNITRIQSAGSEHTAQILSEMGREILTDPRLEKQARRAAIVTFQTFAHEAALPAAERHPAIVKTTLAYFPPLLNTSLDARKYFEVHLGDLRRFFDIA